MATKAVSSGSLFKTLIELGKKSATESRTKLSGTEVKAALDSFNWSDQKTTKAEVIAARKEFQSLKDAGKLTAAGTKAFEDWFASTGVGAAGGFTFDRSAVAYRNLENFLHFNPQSAGGATLTKAEAQALLSTLGAAPSPARLADVRELRSRLTGSPESLKVVDAWLKKHPMAAPVAPLAGALAPLLTDALWPSESDRPVYAVDIGPAPRSTQNIAKAAREALGEPSTAPVEVRDFEQTFDHLTTVFDPGDTVAEERARKFGQIRDALKASLTDLHVLRVGTIDIDVYAVGKDARGHWVGVMSSLVET